MPSREDGCISGMPRTRNPIAGSLDARDSDPGKARRLRSEHGPGLQASRSAAMAFHTADAFNVGEVRLRRAEHVHPCRNATTDSSARNRQAPITVIAEGRLLMPEILVNLQQCMIA